MYKIRLILTLWVLLLGLAAQAAIDVSDLGVGARTMSIGRAYVGLADDASAIFTNPAGLAKNNSLQLVSMSGTILTEVSYVLLGAANNSPLGRFGIGYVNASVGSIPLTVTTGSGSTAAVTQYGLSEYSSSMIVFSYGSRLSRFLKGGAGNGIGVGANLKIFAQGFTGGAPSPVDGVNPLNNAIGGGMDADLGLMWDARPGTTLGLTLKNFLPENFGGKFVWQKNSVVESIPMTVRLGGCFNLFNNPNPESQQLRLLVDHESYPGQNRPATWHTGIEYVPLPTFALRLGLDQKPKAEETGTGIDSNLSGGVGVSLAGFSFDFAYHQFGELKENATYFLSIGYTGEDKENRKAERREAKRKPTLPLPEIVPKPRLKTFVDVPEDYWARKPIQYLATLNIMDGYSDGTFRPTKEITRGELAVLIVKAKGFSVGKEVKVRFSDISLQNYEAPYISIAVERGYINGYPDGTFRPGQRVTRAEMAQIMAHFAGLFVKSKLTAKVYTDLPASHWASPAVAATKETGFFEYLGDRGFGPDLFLTRAEAAEIISKTPFAKQQIEKLISGEPD